MAGQFDVVDFTIDDHGSVMMFIPHTAEAEQAMDDMQLEGWQMMGRGFAVDWRSAQLLVDALLDNGLAVQYSN